jgi:hypothetical protein
MKFKLIGLVFCMLGSCLSGDPLPRELMGDWTLTLSNGEAAWLSVSEVNGEPSVCMLVDVGTIRPLQDVEVREKIIYIPLRTQRDGKSGPVISSASARVWWEGGRLVGQVNTVYADGKEDSLAFTGKPIPPMPPTPDLSRIKFGDPISLLNGKDLSGWSLWRPSKINGWSVEDGLLVNSTPKIDFSSTGAYGNLRTEDVFDDFKLHIEFLIESDRNSGVYLRGMYEAQVVDRDSRMQGLQGVGAIFSRIPPTENVGRPGGEWQSYDITLVDRHISVVLNGVRVIDNQPVPGPTGGAMHTDPMAPGPIYLQGDHTSVKYRNIYLSPRVK